MSNFYGYIRVSSVDQNIDRQVIELQKWGIVEKNLYIDKISGKNFERPEYKKLKKTIKTGDVLVVKSLDRLGRNYEQIQVEWRELVKDKGVDIVVIDMPILDTRTNKDLIGTLISDIVLQLLSYVAQVERENIKQRQAEGIAIAKAKGVKFGRVSHVIPNEFYAYYDKLESKKMTYLQCAQAMGISKNQFEWMVRKHRKKVTLQ